MLLVFVVVSSVQGRIKGECKKSFSTGREQSSDDMGLRLAPQIISVVILIFFLLITNSNLAFIFLPVNGDFFQVFVFSPV